MTFGFDVFDTGNVMNRLASTLAVAPAASLAAVPSLAHHSAVGRYDAASILEVEGEIAEVRWRSPHVMVDARSRE